MVRKVLGSSGIVLLKIDPATNKPIHTVDIDTHLTKLIFMDVSPAVEISFGYSSSLS